MDDKIREAILGRWPDAQITTDNGRLLFRLDFQEVEGNTAGWPLYCDVQEYLATFGWQIDDVYIEHDCVSGPLRRTDS